MGFSFSDFQEVGGLGSYSLYGIGATEDGVPKSISPPPALVQGGLPSGRFASGEKQVALQSSQQRKEERGHAQH